jgi:uroporphyrinogen decarboxylase
MINAPVSCIFYNRLLQEGITDMNSRERVLTTLKGEEPDRVPYFELGIDRALAQRLMGWGEPSSQAADLDTNIYSVEEARAVASFLKMDNIFYVLRAPVYAEKVPGMDGRLFYGEGLIKNPSDLVKIILPDPYDDTLYREAEEFAKQKEDFACCIITRIGIFPTILSMGIETFSIALYEDRSFIEAVLDAYCSWTEVMAERACQLGFDIFVSTDDMAFKSAPYFSPQVFRDLVLPWYQRISQKITLPWIVHSDGNILPFLPDLMSVGISGLHPNEKGAMDIREVKRNYGRKVCLLGNVDLNILGNGTPDEVEREVKELIRDIGPGGGYMVTSGNSLAGYLIPENVIALSRAVQKYGSYPLRID